MGGICWRKWWWVLAFCLLVGSLYLHFVQQKKMEVAKLALRLDEMEKEKCAALQDRELLELQIVSQNDPSWIEMILMRDLGVVPEGWLKVHFK